MEALAVHKPSCKGVPIPSYTCNKNRKDPLQAGLFCSLNARGSEVSAHFASGLARVGLQRLRVLHDGQVVILPPVGVAPGTHGRARGAASQGDAQQETGEQAASFAGHLK